MPLAYPKTGSILHPEVLARLQPEAMAGMTAGQRVDLCCAHDRRTFLKLLGLGTAALALPDWAHGDEHPKDPAIEAAWRQGFTDRGGAKLLEAIQADKQQPGELQKYLGGIGIEDAIREQDELLFRCVEERIKYAGFGSVGGLVLREDQNGKPEYCPPALVAERIAKSTPVAANPNARIRYSVHGNLCGGEVIAWALQNNVPIKDAAEKIGPGDLFEKVSVPRAKDVVVALRKQLPGRDIDYRAIDGKQMHAPANGHPGQIIYVVDEDKRALDPKFKEIPLGMQVNARLFTEARQFNQQLTLSAGILLGDHGPHHAPVGVLGLAPRHRQEQLTGKIVAWHKQMPRGPRDQIITGVAVSKTA